MHDNVPDNLADIDLAAAIAFALHHRFDGSMPDITVSVSDGVVTLEGRSAAQRDIDKAIEVARRFNPVEIVNAIVLAKAS